MSAEKFLKLSSGGIFISNYYNNGIPKNNKYAVIAFSVCICLAFYILISTEYKALLFFWLNILLFMLFLNKYEDPGIKKILFTGLFIRLLFLLLQVYTAIDLPGAGADTLAYEAHGWEYAQFWRGQVAEISIADAYYYFSALIGFFYYFFGRILLVAHLPNIILGIMIVVYTYKTMFLLFKSVYTARIAVMITSFFPTLVFYSAILLRETIIIFLITLSFYKLAIWIEKGNMQAMLVSLLAIIAASLMHGTLILLTTIHIFLLLFYKPESKAFKLSLKQLLLTSAVLFILLFMTKYFITYKLPENFFDLFSLENLQWYVTERRFGRTEYLVGLVPQSYFDLLWHTPIRVMFFLYAPFIWMVKTFTDYFFLFDALLYIGLSALAVAGFFVIYKKKKVTLLCLIFFIVTILTMYAWGTVNYGTAWRHRAKLVPLLAIGAAVGIQSIIYKKTVLPIGDKLLIDSEIDKLSSASDMGE